MEERTVQQIETRFDFPDGRSIWFDLSVQPIPEGIFILSLDISERRNAEESLQRYARRIEMLHALDQGIIQAQSIPALIEGTLKHLRQIIPCQRANVTVFDETTNEAVIFSLDLDGTTAFGQGKRFPMPPDIKAEFDANNRQVVDDLSIIHDEPRARQLASEGLFAVLRVLMMDQDRPLGSLALMANTRGFFTAEYQQIASEVADQLAIAIRQMQLDEAITRHVQEVEMMRSFLQTTLDALSSGVAVLAPDGTIINVNDTWERFSRDNGGLSATAYLNANYLTICDTVEGQNGEEAAPAAAGIRAVIAGAREDFYLEYPCHAPREKRWFGMRVTPFGEQPPRRVVVAHMDITERRKAEEALLQANETLEQRVLERTTELSHAKERVEAILNNSIDGIMLADANLQIRQTNPAFNALFVTKADTASERSLLDFVNTDDRSQIVDVAQAAIRERTGRYVEVRCVRADGAPFEASFSISYFAESEGREGIVGIIQDITERKREQNALAEERNLLRTLIDTTPDFIYIKDLQHRFLVSNVAHAQARGTRSPDELIGKTDADFFPAELAAQFHAEEEEIFQTGKPLLDYEQPSITEKGGFSWASSNKVPLRNLSGELIGLVGITRDISERKRDREALVASETRFRGFVQAAPIAAVITDSNGVITLVNNQAELLFGYSSSELVGQPVEMLIPPRVHERHVQHRTGYITSPRVRPMGMGMELFALRKDGGEFPVEIQLSYIETDTGPLAITFIVDITERKQRERQLRYYASLQESVTDAVISTSLDFVIQSWNPAAEHIYGWSAEEVVGKATASILQTEFASPELRERILAEFMEHGSWTYEVVQRHKDGHEINILSSTVLFKDENGTPVGVVALNHDITSRKKAERFLDAKVQEERVFQQYLKALNDITIELTQIDQLDDLYRLAVQRGLELLGFERLALFLYDPKTSMALGTFGTDPQGQITDERGFRFSPEPDDIMLRAFQQTERFSFEAGITLYHDMEPLCEGWNAAAVLWNGAQSVGWLIADNAVKHQPATKPLLDILSLYALTLGTLLAQKQVQVALRESEGRYRLLANSINDVVIRFLPSFEYVYVSPSSRAVLGYAPEELLGVSEFQRIHPDDASAIRDLIRGLLVHPDSAAITYRFLHKQGHYLWIEASGRAVVSEQTGEVVEFIFSLRDITARKAAEAALRESELRYRLLADNITDLVTRVDTDGVCLYASPSSRTLVGYAPEELIGKTSIELIHPDDRDYAVAAQLKALDPSVPSTPITYRSRHKDGYYIWLETSGQVIWSDDHTQMLGFILVSRDITERKRIESALLEQRDFLQLVVNNVPGLITVKDREGRFQLANNLSAELYGTTSIEMVGKTDADFNPSRDEVEWINAKDQETLTSGKAIFIPEERVLDRYYQTNKVPLKRGDGIYDRLLVVAADITERKRVEDMLQRALSQEKELGELKSRFVSMASHEFRTPLATILASAETLSAYRQKMTETQIDQRLGNIRGQVDHLKNIIEDVLQLARIQAGRMEFNPVVLNLDGLCRSVIDEFESRPDVTNQLIYSCNNPSREVQLDKKLMRQIINNLVSNAVKYSPDGKKVFIGVEYSGDRLVFAVRDQGIGIPEADLKHLFEPFHRAANVGTISGTGLGLSITREAVALHNGSIEVDSEVGVGTTFIVTIPVSIQIEGDHDENPGH